MEDLEIFDSNPTRLFTNRSHVVLEMYNMAHGDSYLIHSDSTKEGMLIDCGSQSPKVPLVVSATKQLDIDIHALTKRSFVLSHLHTDHYQVLQNLSGFVFNDVFLANVISPSDIHSLLISLKLYSKKNPLYLKALHYLSFVPKILTFLNSKSTIHFVSHKFIIANSLGAYGVLWPQLSQPCGDWPLLESEYINAFISTEVYQKTFRAFSLLFAYAQEGPFEKAIVLSEPKTSDEIGPIAASALKSLQDYIDTSIDVVKYSLKDNLKERLENAANRTSIVLLEKDKSVLFTGDIPNTIYSAYISSLVPKRLFVLKTPHHGSKSCSHTIYPPATIALINEKGTGPYIDWIEYDTPKFPYQLCFTPRITPKSSSTIFVNCRMTIPL